MSKNRILPRDVHEASVAAAPGAGASNPNPVTPPPAIPFFRRGKVIIAGMILLPPAFFAVAYFLGDSWTHESTDDAFVDANIVAIAPRVAGKVISLSVNDNELVAKGAPLFEIDPADFQARVEEDAQSVAVNRATAAGKEAAYEQALAHVQTAQQFTNSARASAEQARADAARLTDDLAREKSLLERSVIAAQEYDDSSKSTTAALAALKAKIAQQDASLAYETESARQLDSAKAQWQSAEAQIAQSLAALSESELQLSYTKVYAPVTGRVTERSVHAGDYLQVGQQVMALVPPDVWITANFKETQLDHMHPGQSATVHVDAYPHKSLRGHVDSIQAGSGARFSLLPPENATGNYVKVVQRVPVKIVLDPLDRPNEILGPGMSVEPTVVVNTSRTPMIVALSLAGAGSLGVLVLGIALLRRRTVL